MNRLRPLVLLDLRSFGFASFSLLSPTALDRHFIVALYDYCNIICLRGWDWWLVSYAVSIILIYPPNIPTAARMCRLRKSSTKWQSTVTSVEPLAKSENEVAK